MIVIGALTQSKDQVAYEGWQTLGAPSLLRDDHRRAGADPVRALIRWRADLCRSLIRERGAHQQDRWKGRTYSHE